MAPCPDDQIRCNGKCLRVGESEGNCTAFAKVESTDRSSIAAIASNDQSDLFVGITLFNDTDPAPATLLRYAAAGGAPTTLVQMRLNYSGLFVTESSVYFTTMGELSTVRHRMTGSLGQVPIAGGTPQLLAHDLADDYIQKTATNFYVAANDLDPGLRRYDLTGKGETLLYDKDMYDFEIVGDSIYFINSGFGTKTVMKIPLAGGAAVPFGTGQCQKIFGADAQNLYVDCIGPTRIALADGTTTRIGDTPEDGEYPAMRGSYLYYTTTESTRDGTLLRMSVTTAAVEDLATFEGGIFARGHVVTPDRVYVVLADLSSRKPSFILKVDL